MTPELYPHVALDYLEIELRKRVKDDMPQAHSTISGWMKDIKRAFKDSIVIKDLDDLRVMGFSPHEAASTFLIPWLNRVLKESRRLDNA